MRKSETARITILEAAKLVGYSIPYMKKVAQEGVFPFITVYQRGVGAKGQQLRTYVISPGGMANYLGVTSEELTRRLAEIRRRP